MLLPTVILSPLQIVVSTVVTINLQSIVISKIVVSQTPNTVSHAITHTSSKPGFDPLV